MFGYYIIIYDVVEVNNIKEYTFKIYSNYIEVNIIYIIGT